MISLEEELNADVIDDNVRIHHVLMAYAELMSEIPQDDYSELSEQLASADQKPRHWNLLIALMPYAAPGSLTVVEPISSLPDWLLPDYVSHCEPALTSQLVQPAGLLQPADDPLATIGPLAERRGEEAMDWFRDGAALPLIPFGTFGALGGASPAPPTP